MAGVFISYRRADSAPYAGRIYDRLSAHFGADQVFMDVDDIPPGENFVAHIEAKVASCDAMVAVIGRNWLTLRNDADQLRLSDPEDFVGLEIALALERNILVVPALVGGAKMPSPRDLPKPLKKLAQRNAVTLDDEDFQRDAEQLIQVLEKVPGLRGSSAIAAKEGQQLAARRRKLWGGVALLLVMAALFWQWNQFHKQRVSGDAPSGLNSPAVAALSGWWTGDVAYGWGARYTERFLFQPEGDKLFGTASFLAFKRGIEDGRIEGDKISFTVRFETVSEDIAREHKNSYLGTISGNQIHFRMQDDRGNPPIEFVVKKELATG
jgi:TIR domain